MIIHVQYKDFHYEYVDTRTFERLLAGKKLKLFYRPSEKRWIYVMRDPIRGTGGDYSGPDRRERRKAGRARKSMKQLHIPKTVICPGCKKEVAVISFGYGHMASCHDCHKIIYDSH